MILTVGNTKGGVGKTTLAVNIAFAFAFAFVGLGKNTQTQQAFRVHYRVRNL